MADPVIPNIPTSADPGQTQFFNAIKAGIEHLLGHGRFKEADRAVKVSELEALAGRLGANIENVALGGIGDADPGDAPAPPTNLIVTKAPFVHILTWDNPIDTNAWFVEIWASEGSQIRDDARLEGIYTITEDTRGKQGTFKHVGFSPTADMTYWIRSVSYGGMNSPWCPPDDQGGYVVLGAESIQAVIDGILEILQGKITENQLYQDLSDKIDKIAVNGTNITNEGIIRNSADASLAQNIDTVQSQTEDNDAAIQTETTARTTGDSANATAIQTVQTTVGNHTTSIQTHAESIDGLGGKYTVKIDANGYVAGFGLAVEDNDGVPASEFIMLVDSFKIVTPGKNPRVPFIVGAVGGVSTIGVDGNMVVDGTITALKLDVDSVKARHIDTTELFIGMLLQSLNYVAGTTGWKLDNDGLVINSSGGIKLNQNADIKLYDGDGNEDGGVINRDDTAYVGDRRIRMQLTSGPSGQDWVQIEYIYSRDIRVNKLLASGDAFIGKSDAYWKGIYSDKFYTRGTTDWIESVYSDSEWWMYFYVGSAYAMTVSASGSLWIKDSCSAASFIDRSHIYTGEDAIDLLRAVRPESTDKSDGPWKKVDHDTLPDTVKVMSKKTRFRHKMTGKVVNGTDIHKDHNPKDYDISEIDVPGRDIGRQLQIATQAILLLTARVEKLESQFEKQEFKKTE